MESKHLTDVAFKLSIDLGLQLEGSPELQGIDLSPMHMRVLRFLHDLGTATPVEIAAAVRRDKGHVTRLLNDLKTEGLICLSPNPQDGRSKVVTLTEGAQDIFKKIHTAEARIIDRAKTGVSADDFDTFLKVAHKISVNLSTG